MSLETEAVIMEYLRKEEERTKKNRGNSFEKIRNTHGCCKHLFVLSFRLI
jgi:hypothetical protein